MTSSTYGKWILEIRQGKYLWDEVFSEVNFISRGKARPSFRLHLTAKQNTEEGAIKKACQNLIQYAGKDHRMFTGAVNNDSYSAKAQFS